MKYTNFKIKSLRNRHVECEATRKMMRQQVHLTIYIDEGLSISGSRISDPETCTDFYTALGEYLEIYTSYDLGDLFYYGKDVVSLIGFVDDDHLEVQVLAAAENKIVHIDSLRKSL